jgi:hypothetical protein
VTLATLDMDIDVNMVTSLKYTQLLLMYCCKLSDNKMKVASNIYIYIAFSLIAVTSESLQLDM